MSEYQYYHFQAVDRSLTADELAELRSRSTRAHITASGFVNHYSWGDLKADPDDWMDRFFDAFLYVANWGTYRLDLRLPDHLLDLRSAAEYCSEASFTARQSGERAAAERERRQAEAAAARARRLDSLSGHEPRLSSFGLETLATT